MEVFLMAGLSSLISTAFEDIRVNSIDIYGNTINTRASEAMSEAINNQLAHIAEQESSFQVIEQRRENTPITDAVKDIVVAEKERVENVEYR